MKRVWIVAGALLVVALVQLLLVGFVGSDTLRAAFPVMVLSAAAVLIRGGAVWVKAIWIFVGSLVGMLGFVLGAGMFPDNNFGYFLGAAVPLLIVGVLVMWTKRVQYLVAVVCGVAAFQSVYTTFFFSDPQSINFSMPVAYGIMMVPMALTFLVFSVITELLPDLLDDPHPAVPSEPTQPSDGAPAAEQDDSQSDQTPTDSADQSEAAAADDTTAEPGADESAEEETKTQPVAVDEKVGA